MKGVVGLDLSLRSSAACWIPGGWAGDTKQLKVAHYGHALEKNASEDERADRMRTIADGIVAFCRLVKVNHTYVEDHAFGLGGASATETHEMTGHVKVALRIYLGCAPIPVNISTGRKTLLQKLPGRGAKVKAKEFTEQNVRRLKGEALYWNGDEIDAFVVANHGMMLEGGTPLSFLGT